MQTVHAHHLINLCISAFLWNPLNPHCYWHTRNSDVFHKRYYCYCCNNKMTPVCPLVFYCPPTSCKPPNYTHHLPHPDNICIRGLNWWTRAKLAHLISKSQSPIYGVTSVTIMHITAKRPTSPISFLSCHVINCLLVHSPLYSPETHGMDLDLAET